MRTVLPLALLLSLIAPTEAQAGARAFYVMFIDASEGGDDPEAAAILNALLSCGDTALPECRAAHSPERTRHTYEGIRLYPQPEGVSSSTAASALRSGAARRQLREALQAEGLWMDGIIVFQRSARSVTLSVMNGQGRPMGRVTRPLRGGSLRQVDRARMVTAIMRPVRANFSP